jgi:organic hydroperoxide reductase OsmC/OhrA
MTEASTHSCNIEWRGNTLELDNFSRQHRITFPSQQELSGGTAGKASQDFPHTNPEELLAAAVGTCLMMTVLAVFSKSRIKIVSYSDNPEALLEFVDRRYRVTKVTLHPIITVSEGIDIEKFNTLIQKSHANCFIALSVKSDVVIEPTFLTE